MDKGRLTVGSLGNQEIDQGTPLRGKWVTLPQAASAPRRRRFNRVLLLNPAATLFKNDYPRCTYPLGVGYIAAVLEKFEYTVKILDVFAEGYSAGVPIDPEGHFISYGLHDEGVIDVAQPDCGYTGGISQMKKIAALCEAFFVPLAPHCTQSYLGMSWQAVHIRN